MRWMPLRYVPALLMAVALLGGCAEDKLDDGSIFDNKQPTQTTALDKWLRSNYVYPYNVDVKYKWEDVESDMGYNITPIDYAKAYHLAKIMKHAWFEVYDEVTDGYDFCRAYAPKLFYFVGSPEYEYGGAMKLGTAEGGIKVTLIMGNLIDSMMNRPAELNEYYLHTMHHEFTHILNQQKNYDRGFELVSEGRYVQGDWKYVSLAEALMGGFITAYAASEPREDFAEMLSVYVTSTAAEWKSYMNTAAEGGGDAHINLKLNFVRTYMKDVWSIDLEELRTVVHRRTGEVTMLDYSPLEE